MYTFKITTTLAANYPILQNFVPNISWDKAIWSYCWNIRMLSLKYSSINISIWNKRKFVKKGGIPSKIPIYLILFIVDYKTWYQIKFETLHFD